MRRKPYTHENFDFFQHSTTISAAWIRQADQEYQRIIHQENDTNTAQDTDET